MDKVEYENASILDGYHCNECGWKVIDVCCNGSFVDYVKTKGASWDWWQYCSNKACKNHDGEGVFQEPLEWVCKD